MKYRITDPKRIMIIASIILALVAILLLIFFSCYNPKKEVSSKSMNEEDRIAEELVDETIDIEELEEQEIEEEQNVVENTTKNETTNNTNNQTPYYIKVNYGAQVVTIYKKDEQGNYTIPVKAMVCSTGTYTPTSGVYLIPARWEWLHLQGDVYGHYSTQIKGNILFHSVPYLRKGDPASLEYWEYDKLGTYASAGCVRLTVKDAKWIYDNCAKGTKVEFYSSSNPGPLGKPSTKKISSYPDNLRNWDPTDPASNNPWRNYKPEENKNTNTETNNNVNSNNTQTNENTNTYNNEIKENEIANEVNTNTLQTNEMTTNETVNKPNTQANEVQTNDKVNKEVVSDEESLNTNITL